MNDLKGLEMNSFTGTDDGYGVLRLKHLIIISSNLHISKVQV